MQPGRLSADPALARVLRSERERRALTQETLAMRAGVTLGAVSRVELGLTNPSWALVRRIATGLDLSMAQLGRLVDDER